MIRIEEADFSPDLYTRLEIERNATATEIARAYRKRAMATHPDRNPDNPHAGAEFVAVGRAYEVLKDPSAKGMYDKMLDRRGHSADAAAQSDEYNRAREDGDGSQFHQDFQSERERSDQWQRARDLYKDFEYTPEDLARYVAAAERMARGEYRSGDLGTVFNTLAGNGPARGKHLIAGGGDPLKLSGQRRIGGS